MNEEELVTKGIEKLKLDFKMNDDNLTFSKYERQRLFYTACAMQKEIDRLNHIIDELKENIQNLIYDIQPKGCLIIFNCEYDSEEDYIKGMKKEERLRTLEEVLDKLKELKEEGETNAKKEKN